MVIRLNATYKDDGSKKKLAPKFFIPFWRYTGPELPVCGLLAMKEKGSSVLDIISKVFKYLQLNIFFIHIRTLRYILDTHKVKI